MLQTASSSHSEASSHDMKQAFEDLPSAQQASDVGPSGLLELSPMDASCCSKMGPLSRLYALRPYNDRLYYERT